MPKPIGLVGLLLVVAFAGCSTGPCPIGQELREARDPEGQFLAARGCVKRDAEGNVILQGRWTTWHPNGQKSFESSFENGQRHGRRERWATASPSESNAGGFRSLGMESRSMYRARGLSVPRTEAPHLDQKKATANLPKALRG